MTQTTKSLLIFLTLWTLAVVSPLLGVLSAGAEFFIVRRSSSFEVMSFLIVLIIVPPALLWLLAVIFRSLFPRLGRSITALGYFFLLNALGLMLLNRYADLSGIASLTTSACLSLLIITLSTLTLGKRLVSALLILSPIIALAPIQFLYSPGIRAIVLPQNALKYSTKSTSTTTPVVLVVFDELPLSGLLLTESQFDAERFPHFAELASQSHWFKNATSINQFTPIAVPAIFSGQRPKSPNVLPSVAWYPLNIFTALGSQYTVQAYEPITQLCPSDICLPSSDRASVLDKFKALAADVLAVYLQILIPKDLELGAPEIDGKWGDFWHEDSTHMDHPTFSRESRFRDFQSFISSLSTSERPGLIVYHAILPHMPYQLLPSGRSYSPSDTRGYRGNRWSRDPQAISDGYHQFLLQLGAADNLLGQLISKLKSLAIYDQALMIVVADHGMSFEPDSYRRGQPKSSWFYEDVLNVPLLIKLPGQLKPEINERNVETIDVLPTILDVLKIPAPGALDGQSVFSTLAPRSGKEVLIGRVPERRGRASVAAPAERSGTAVDWGQDLVGQTLKYSIPAAFPNARLHWKQSLLPSAGAQDPFYVGPFPALIGQEIKELLEKTPSSAQLYRLNRVPFSAPHVVQFANKDAVCPCRFTGQISAPGMPKDSALGIAVNGILASVTWPYPGAEGRQQFEFLLNDIFYTEGGNRINFVEILSAPGGYSLRPIN